MHFKRRPIQVTAVLLAIYIQFPVPASAQVGETYSFDFPTGASLDYEVDINVAIDMFIKQANMNVKMSFGVQQTISLTETAQSEDGISTLSLEPQDVSGTMDMPSPTGGRMVITFKGDDIVGRQGPNVFIDTKRNIGTDIAAEMRKEMEGSYLSGELDIDRLGNIIDIRGKKAFVEKWEASMQFGLLGLLLPEDPVAPGESWDHTTVFRRMGTISLKEPGVESSVTYTRMRDDGHVRVFQMSAPSHASDVVAFQEQGAQLMRLDISSLVRDESGTIRFDAAQGRVLESESSGTIKISSSAKPQGQTMSFDYTIRTDSKTRLLNR